MDVTVLPVSSNQKKSRARLDWTRNKINYFVSNPINTVSTLPLSNYSTIELRSLLLEIGDITKLTFQIPTVNNNNPANVTNL